MMGQQFTGIPKKESNHTPAHKAERKPLLSNSTKRKLKRALIVAIVLAVLGGIFTLFVLISSFYDKHAFRFQTPIIIQTPVVMYDRQAVIKEEVDSKVKALLPTPTLTPKPTEPPKYLNFNLVPKAYASFKERPYNPGEAEIINSQKHAKVIWRIYMLESTFGKQDGCKDQGMVNGFGFAIHSSGTRCYSNFADVVADVNAWIDEKYNAGWSLGTILCYYNRGLKVNDCPYEQKFFSII